VIASSDIVVIGECFALATEGSVFPEWEFRTLFGRSRDELREVAAQLTKEATVTRPTAKAVQNVCANVFGYPGVTAAEWNKWVSVSAAEARVCFDRWLAANVTAT
jgi:hypothetical protein